MRQPQRRVGCQVAGAFDMNAAAVAVYGGRWPAFPADQCGRAGLTLTASGARARVVGSSTHESTALRGRPGWRSDLGLPFHQTCPATTPAGRFDFGRPFNQAWQRSSDRQAEQSASACLCRWATTAGSSPGSAPSKVACLPLHRAPGKRWNDADGIEEIGGDHADSPVCWVSRCRLRSRRRRWGRSWSNVGPWSNPCMC